MCSSSLACLRMLVTWNACCCQLLLHFVLFVDRIGHKVLVYITVHCIHFCSDQTHHMEDTVTSLSSLVSLTSRSK